MAVRVPVVTENPDGQRNCQLIVWSGLLNGPDTGTPVQVGDFADRSFQITGTFGAGGSITIEGSNDGVTYFPLTDPQGNAITKTAAALEVASECTRYVRPSVTAGDGTTSLAVALWARRNR